MRTAILAALTAVALVALLVWCGLLYVILWDSLMRMRMGY